MIARCFILFFSLVSGLFAGSADAHIVGTTSSGRTSVEVDVGDIDGILGRAKLTIDGKSYEITQGRQTVIRDEANSIYVLMIESETQIFRMWMIPNTEKVIPCTDGATKIRFGAIIEATDPRQDEKWKLTPRITIGCTLNYEI